MKSLKVPTTMLFLTVLLNLIGLAHELRAETTPSEVAPAGQSDAKKIVAKFSGQEISLEQLDQEIKKRPSNAQYLDGQSGNAETQRQVRSMVLSQMIDRRLLVDSATKAQIKLSDEELNEMYAASITRFGGDEQLDVFLKGMGLTRDTFKQELRSDILISKYIQEVLTKDLVIPEEQLKSNYETNKATYALGEAIHLRHILIKVEPSATETETKAAQTKIDKLYESVIKPDANFPEIAKANSECPSAANGGDLDFVEKGKTVKEFEDAAFVLKPGEISKPVKTQFGFHIIKQEDRREPRQLAFDEVKQYIEQRLRQEKSGEMVKAKLEDLRRSEKVEILL